MSPVALVGGNEFRRECDLMDRALLELMGGAAGASLSPARAEAHPDGAFGAAGASVAILPTAATNENPYVAGENGMRHFRRLGAAPDKLMVEDEASANRQEIAAALEQFRIVYFTGGDPIYLLETLRGSLIWESVLNVHARGGLIAGSSAGAMAFGGQMWRFDGWTPGLNLVPWLAVLPHHVTMSARWDALSMAASLPAGVTLVGIDEATALLLPEGRVLGVGEVTIYLEGGPQAYANGALVPLQKMIP